MTVIRSPVSGQRFLRIVGVAPSIFPSLTKNFADDKLKVNYVGIDFHWGWLARRALHSAYDKRKQVDSCGKSVVICLVCLKSPTFTSLSFTTQLQP